jgi:hypothetical protein
MQSSSGHANALAQAKAAFREAVEHHQAGRRAEAEAAYLWTIAFAPTHASACNNLAALLMERGKFEAAEIFYRRALQSKPDYPDALNNLGNLLKEQNRLAEAIDAYREALRLKPDFAEARYNAALAHLRTGDMPACWREYESRWESSQLRQAKRDFAQPMLAPGMSVAGKTILVWAEQGMGDTMQMLRYVPLLAAQGATIYVELQRAVSALLARVRGAERVFVRGDALPAFDLHCPMMSLPYVFETWLDTIPADIPYIAVDPRNARRADAEAVNDGALQVGLCWKGNPAHRNDAQRSPGIEPFKTLFSVDGARFLGLVPGMRADFLNLVRHAAIDPGHDLVETPEGFVETAALINDLDLVISCDTSIAHLAGAMGKPVWLVLPFVPEWRWLMGREDSPWYPTMRVFRQARRHDWPELFGRVREHLAEAARDRSRLIWPLAPA